MSKYLFFEVCNNFCSLFISVGYQAFSEGTDWQVCQKKSPASPLKEPYITHKRALHCL